MIDSTLTFLFIFFVSILNGQWQEMETFIGTARDDAVGFSINGKGYAGSGREIGFALTNDFFEYDPDTAQWTEVASLPGIPVNTVEASPLPTLPM